MLEYLLLLFSLIRATVRDPEVLVTEDLLLRQQLAVLTRPTRKPPRLRTRDKLFWVWSALSAVIGAGTWSWFGPRGSSAGTGRPGASCGAGAHAGQSAARGSAPRHES
jgi:hypothetical protein